MSLEEVVQIIKNRLLQTEPTTVYTPILFASWENDQELNGHDMIAIFRHLIKDAGIRNFIEHFDFRVNERLTRLIPN